MRHWDISVSINDNIRQIKQDNVIGAKNEAWLHEVFTTFSSRFNEEKNILPLVILAQGDLHLDAWKACYLFHIGTIDQLYYKFATDWLFPEFEEGTYLLRTSDVAPFVSKITSGKISSGGNLSEYGTVRTARDLLRMATDFGLLTGKVTRQFAPYHIPEESFLYVLHALAEQSSNASKNVRSPYWKLYLMRPEDVERELFRLHQFKKLEYHVAGSLAQLNLPHTSLMEYAKELPE